jgi:hypothetical protein
MDIEIRESWTCWYHVWSFNFPKCGIAITFWRRAWTAGLFGVFKVFAEIVTH